MNETPPGAYVVKNIGCGALQIISGKYKGYLVYTMDQNDINDLTKLLTENLNTYIDYRAIDKEYVLINIKCSISNYLKGRIRKVCQKLNLIKK